METRLGSVRKSRKLGEALNANLDNNTSLGLFTAPNSEKDLISIHYAECITDINRAMSEGK